MKKKSRFIKNLLKVALVLPVFLFFINYGCQSNDSDQAAGLNYSGEEIFKGLFFLQGDLPDHIEALKAEYEKSQSAMAANKEVEEFQLEFSDEIIKSISVLDPDFFKNFKTQMESKNYYAIQLAMANAAKMLKAGGYNSKYASFFKLSDQLKSKKVDITDDEFRNIDVNTPEGMAKFKSLMKNKYEIDLDDENYKIACAPSLGFCIIVLVVAGVTLAVAVNYVVNLNEYWGGVKSQNAVGNVLIEELAAKLGSNQGLLKYN